MTSTPIPLVDLNAQYQAMKSELDNGIAAVVAQSAFVGTPGNRFVRAFEEEFAAYVGRTHCIACGNGTDSLEILLRAAGIGNGDEVLVPAVSWIATSASVSSCGATPVFVDVLPDIYSIDPGAAIEKITSKTRAIIPVHLYGMPARMDEICSLAAKHGLFLLEDCAQAHGAMYYGRQVGTFGNAASYSFFPGKNLGAWGDAGAMVTNDEALASKARMIAQQGQGERKHDHQLEGRNSRMDGIQAAILSAKLRHLDAWIKSRRELAADYQSDLQNVVDRMQTCPEGMESVFHLFVVEVNDREAVVSALASDGISTAVHYPRPLPLLAAYARRGHKADEFPVADAMTRRILSIPIFPEMTKEQLTRVKESLRRIQMTVPSGLRA